MDSVELERLVRATVLVQLVATGKRLVPAAVSNRHVHLSEADKNLLFGVGYRLTPMKALSQPGQFACRETLDFVGAKGTLEKIRVLGPERSATQLELAVTDCYKAGVTPVVRNSGDITGTPGGVLIGPAGRTEIVSGVIVSARHLHISAEQAAVYSLTDGQLVTLQTGGVRGIALQNVLVRTGKGHELELHLDTDEANACMLRNGDLLELMNDCVGNVEVRAQNTAQSQTQIQIIPTNQMRIVLPLVTERDILQAARSGEQSVCCTARAIITPLAKDAANDKRIAIVRAGE